MFCRFYLDYWEKTIYPFEHMNGFKYFFCETDLGVFSLLDVTIDTIAT